MIKNKIPRELTRGLFNPEFIPRDIDLNDFVREGSIEPQLIEARKRVSRRINTGADNINTPEVPIPIPVTELEAQEADIQIQNTLLRIEAARAQLAFTRSTLDTAINEAEGGKELRFKINVSKKPRIKRALKKLYGEKLDTITYGMYKELLKAKVLLEEAEVEDFAAGKTEEDEDTDEKDKEE